jgi:hypothetical protein
MRKLLLAGVFALVPFVAFADQTNVSAGAGVQSAQATEANATFTGKSAGMAAVVSGNYTDVNSAAGGQSKKGTTTVNAGSSQLNIGGTVVAGNTSGNASAKVGGGQNSQANGWAKAKAH